MSQKQRLRLFFIITFYFNMAASFVHPVTPTLIVERGLGSSLFGVALAAMMCMNFLFSPLWGRLCSYLPTRRILLICGIGYALGQVIFGLAHSELLVILGRSFAGIFVGGIFTANANYLLNTESPELRGQHLTKLAMMNSVGGACGYFVGGMLGLISVEFAFFVQAVSLAACGILYGLVCLDDSPFKDKPTAPLHLRDANPFSAFLTARSFLTPMLGMIFLMTAISAIGHNSYEQCFNYFIKDQYGMTSAYNGIIKAGIAALSLGLNASLCMYLQKKTNIHKSFLPVLLICTAVLFCSLLPVNQWIFVGIYILYSGIYAVRLPLLQSMAASRAGGSNSNAVMGFYQAMNSLGGIFGAAFAGLIYDIRATLPFLLAFIAYALASVLGISYFLRYSKEKG